MFGIIGGGKRRAKTVRQLRKLKTRAKEEKKKLKDDKLEKKFEYLPHETSGWDKDWNPICTLDCPRCTAIKIHKDSIKPLKDSSI